ncbi:MAG: hypothetical protein ABI867_20935 [Kofleriaceae bacterium]
MVPGPTFPPVDAGAPGAPPPITAPGFYGAGMPVATDAGVSDANPADAYQLPPLPDGGLVPDAAPRPVSQ